MTSENSKEAVESADRLRKKWVAGNKPARNIFDLAWENDVLVFRLALDRELSGAFIRSLRHKISIIFVNTTQKNLFHQRFTLAHELGHLELHKDQDGLVEGVANEEFGDPRDHQANVFAAQFLVPLKVISSILKSYGVDAKEVSNRLVIELAQMFGVSHEVILLGIKILANLQWEIISKRIKSTDWKTEWKRYAPEDYSNTLCQDKPCSWKAEGVSDETAQQISRLPGKYREMAFEAFQRRKITAGKLAEILGLEGKQVVRNELLPILDPDLYQQDQEMIEALKHLSENGDA